VRALLQRISLQDTEGHLDGKPELACGGESVGHSLEHVQPQLAQPLALTLNPRIVPVRQ